MELPKQFYDAANSKVKPDDGEWGEGFWAGYTEAASEVFNALEADYKKRIVMLEQLIKHPRIEPKEKERCETCLGFLSGVLCELPNLKTVPDANK